MIANNNVFFYSTTFFNTAASLSKEGLSRFAVMLFWEVKVGKL
jgi:hypothetical protein